MAFASLFAIRIYGKRQGIKRYNLACGIENTYSQGYHETITQFYVLLIARFIETIPFSNKIANIDLLADKLLKSYGDKSLIFEYYSRDRLISKTARLEWVEPDLKLLK